MSDAKLGAIAGALLVVGCLIGGLIIVSGVLADWPGADTLMAVALAALVPATFALIYWLRKLGEPS